MWEGAASDHELHNLGNDCYRSGQFEKAVEFYNRAIEENGHIVETYFNRALAYARLGEYDAALADATFVITQNAALHEAYYLRGRVRELRLEDREALGDYDTALSLKPDFAAASERRAITESREWTFRDLRDLRDRTEIEPDNGYLRFQFGQRLLMIGHADDAARALERARALNFCLTDLWAELGQAYVQLRQPVKAMAAFRQAIKTNPTESSPYGLLGQLLTEAGHHREAVTVFRQALTMPNNDAGTLYCGLGAALCNLRKWDESRDAFRSALMMDPQMPDALAGMGMVAWRTGDRIQAAERCGEALEHSPGLIQAVVLSLNLAVREGDLETAREAAYILFRANSEDHRSAYVLWLVEEYLAHQTGLVEHATEADWAVRRQLLESARRLVRYRVGTRSDLLQVQRDLSGELLACCPVAQQAAEELYQRLATSGKEALATLYQAIRQPALMPASECLQNAARVAQVQEQDWLAGLCLAYADMLAGTPEAPRVDGLVQVLTRLKNRGISHADVLRDLYALCHEGMEAETVHTMIGLAPRVFRLALMINQPGSLVPEVGAFLVLFAEWLGRFERAARWVLPVREWPDLGEELAELRNRLMDEVPLPERWALAAVLTSFGAIARRYVPIN